MSNNNSDSNNNDNNNITKNYSSNIINVKSGSITIRLKKIKSICILKMILAIVLAHDGARISQETRC
jgi:hypothetical protein